MDFVHVTCAVMALLLSKRTQPSWCDTWDA
jgi:hypothetical protein